MSTAEERLLRAVIKNTREDGRSFIKQEASVCPRCGTNADISDDSIKSDYREVKFGKKTIVLAEPYCPRCGVKIEARFTVNH